jgi:probable HAF family extracellular repeat protein
LTNLNTLAEVSAAGWNLREAIAINNVGQITGTGHNASGEERAFLLSPK